MAYASAKILGHDWLVDTGWRILGLLRQPVSRREPDAVTGYKEYPISHYVATVIRLETIDPRSPSFSWQIQECPTFIRRRESVAQLISVEELMGEGSDGKYS